MWGRMWIRMLLFLVSFWYIDIYQLMGGQLVPIQKTLVRKSKSSFEFEDGIYDLEYASQQPGLVLGNSMSFLWQGSGGGMTALPLGVSEYLEEYAKDRQAVRETPIYDPEREEMRLMPSLDYKIAYRLIRREHVEGWFGQEKNKRLMRLLTYALIGIIVLGGGIAYVGGNPHYTNVCYDTHQSANTSGWTQIVCPKAQKVTSTQSTGSGSSTSSTVSTVQLGGGGT